MAGVSGNEQRRERIEGRLGCVCDGFVRGREVKGQDGFGKGREAKRWDGFRREREAKGQR